MKWKDIIGCWLFELGNFPVSNTTRYNNLPTLGFTGADYTISGNPNDAKMRHHKIKNSVADSTSVSGLRIREINQIKNTGSTSFLNDEWVFGTDATIDTITKLDGMQFCLGSYQTNVYIKALGNKQYELTFIVKNKTGWESGTRGLNDYNGNSTDDGVLKDKTKRRWASTIGETFGWKEVVTVP